MANMRKQEYVFLEQIPLLLRSYEFVWRLLYTMNWIAVYREK